MLAVFTANLLAICHCADAATVASVAKHSCCEAKHTDKDECTNPKPLCNHKDGCHEGNGIKFNLLDKQASEKIDLSPIFATAFVHHYLSSIFALQQTLNSGKFFDKDRLQYYPPPDLQVLYQTFLI